MAQDAPENWDATLDAIDDWICIIDKNARILRSNQVVESKFNTPVKTAVGQTCCQLAHGTPGRIDGCPLPRMLETGKRESAELELANGLWVLVTVDPVRDTAGKICGAVHIARDITQRILIQNERERLVTDLKKALSRIKTLSGLLPICASCKKIRDDKGYWNLLESYIESHSHACFSHSLCPDCIDSIYGAEPWYAGVKKELPQKQHRKNEDNRDDQDRNDG
ncbi:MAG: PAS domain-containing protein [Desulfobacterales bacterium]|nr:PAS domain-containing protein [Desulfobacterales bacterium]